MLEFGCWGAIAACSGACSRGAGLASEILDFKAEENTTDALRLVRLAALRVAYSAGTAEALPLVEHMVLAAAAQPAGLMVHSDCIIRICSQIRVIETMKLELHIYGAVAPGMQGTRLSSCKPGRGLG